MKQIGRKLYHVMGGIGLLAIYYLLGRHHALPVYALIFVAVLSFDIMRITSPTINDFVFRYFGSFIRKNEKDRLTGTAFYVGGVGLTFFIYSQPIATAAICFLIFGDVSATAIGERYGKTRIGNKSLEGTVAFAVAALAAGVILSAIGIGTPPWVMLVGALAAAAVELPTLPVNDNFVIPVASGGVMQLLVSCV